MKTQEELQKLREDVAEIQRRLKELTEKELEAIFGGTDGPWRTNDKENMTYPEIIKLGENMTWPMSNIFGYNKSNTDF